jgi:hypothetical protein
MKELKSQEERLDYLLQKFKEDSVQYKNLEVEKDYYNRRMTLRSLMNIRMPRKIETEVIMCRKRYCENQ